MDGGRRHREKGALVLTGLITIVGVLTGYWLALPGRWRQKLARVRREG